jgi:hypothetical protein
MKNHPFCIADGRDGNLDRRLPEPSASDGETVAALGAPGTNHRATAAGPHANEKPVGALATNDGGLVGTFHDMTACEKEST